MNFRLTEFDKPFLVQHNNTGQTFQAYRARKPFVNVWKNFYAKNQPVTFRGQTDDYMLVDDIGDARPIFKTIFEQFYKASNENN